MSLLRDYGASLSQPTLPLPSTRGDGPARFDEVYGANGRRRPAWHGLATTLSELTADDLARIAAEGADLLADDGASAAQRGGSSRPWRLDPVPLVLDAAEWERLEVGLAQRAELLGAVLADLYGPQRLLADGVVPAAAVFGHAGFLRPLVGVSDPAPLVLTGTDLGRDADGAWRVLADRVQAPSGLGYAMENRRVMTRLMPGLHRESGTHRVEPFVSALRTALVHAAPRGDAIPRAVVLSPGTHSETAFDQAFLANVLGFPLVRGGDLVVRDGEVWMKPSGWPRTAPVDRVDVIVRRVDADWSDPLELRGESQLGVTGLVEAVRRGNVRVANGLGAGVLENPALLAYMADVCEHLLGEELRLGVAQSWWCGDAGHRETVLRRLDEAPETVIVRTIDGSGDDLSAASPAHLRSRIERHPLRYAAQLRMPLSQAPVLEGGRHDARIGGAPVTMRAFTVRDGTAQRPFVGGLAMVADGALTPATKDVWVRKAHADDPDQGIDRLVRTALARAVPVFSPRALDDLFWAGRYAERAEDVVRIVLTADGLTRGRRRSQSDGADALSAALARLCGTRGADRDEDHRSALLDADRPGSAADSLARLRDALAGVRDQLSDDTWRVFSATDRAAGLLRAEPGYPLADAAARTLTGLLSLYGVTASMMRDEGWNAFEAGRQLERALQVCLLVQATLPALTGPGAEDALEGVLGAAESAVTYRRRHGGSGRPVEALELLLADPDNPRSLASAVATLGGHLDALPLATGSTRPERLRDDLASRLGGHAPLEPGPRLAAFLSETVSALGRLADAIALVHFESGPLPQPMDAGAEGAAAETVTA
ncbi:circularly permuted type 2 ATP-grasp protein [Microbacterium betulae]|uniref:Circularly permuted type 2 ATP-grasp protein n=1 Tax=Microbacterium betulae TaxID=2981139 RepID=A0AA97I613_9MICO|nr:circularly permuted type 2 ATP-grasp protein [Microbacterium sp. AB]WOF23324.1 circularly permuted type 2 ATP-grasp protein [Microbacterium sp. AB]